MNQIAIEFTPLARRTDPHTSIDAGRKAQESTVALHERLILEALFLHGPMTAKEMEAYTGLSSVQISRRSGGLIHTKPYRCQYNGTRNGFKVWELVP